MGKGPSFHLQAEASPLTHPFLAEIALFSFLENNNKCPLHSSWVSPHAVHGSLARAGKVKSQTPKVDKQEKKKSPKGRAKKRIIYNRRYVPLQGLLLISTQVADPISSFVNVTTAPGGKRRM